MPEFTQSNAAVIDKAICYDITEGVGKFHATISYANGESIVREPTDAEVMATYSRDGIEKINAAYSQRNDGKFGEVAMIPPFVVVEEVVQDNGSDDLAPVDAKVRPVEASEPELVSEPVPVPSDPEPPAPTLVIEPAPLPNVVPAVDPAPALVVVEPAPVPAAADVVPASEIIAAALDPTEQTP